MFFYADEGHEPIHVHAKKGDAECKLWLHTELFDLIVQEWNRRFGDRRHAGN